MKHALIDTVAKVVIAEFQPQNVSFLNQSPMGILFKLKRSLWLTLAACSFIVLFTIGYTALWTAFHPHSPARFRVYGSLVAVATLYPLYRLGKIVVRLAKEAWNTRYI